MTKNELKKLSRTDLLEMLLDQSKKVEALQKKLDESEKALHNKEIMINRAGSIAEASLQLSGIFEAAQRACQQYTENIQKLSTRQEDICRQMEVESQAQADRLISETKKECERMLAETKKQCEEMITRAKGEVQSDGTDASENTENFNRNHLELQEL